MPLEKQLVYDSCKTLPLKLFFEISETGNLKLLGDESESVLVETWESIVLEYGKHDNNQLIQNVVDKKDQLFSHAAMYCEIKAMLLYLVGADKQEYIDRLAELGYKIDNSSHEKRIETIKSNDARANHISTRMSIIKGEIESYSGGKKASFDSCMVWISTELGFEPKEDITVLRFLEYKKGIYERNKAKRSNNRRGV